MFPVIASNWRALHAHGDRAGLEARSLGTMGPPPSWTPAWRMRFGSPCRICEEKFKGPETRVVNRLIPAESRKMLLMETAVSGCGRHCSRPADHHPGDGVPIPGIPGTGLLGSELAPDSTF